MGGTESRPGENLFDPTLKVTVSNPDVAANYQFLTKSYDLRYGDVKILQDQRDGSLLICKETTVNTREAYDKEVRFLSRKIAVSHPNIVRVEGYNTRDKQQFCASFWKISIFIEYIERDLSQEIETRQAERVPYSETDLLNLAENAISALLFYESQSHSHGDVRPLNILVTPEFSYKLSDPSLNIQHPNAIVQTVMGSAQCLLSPELLQAAAKKDIHPKVDVNKSDVYSLGLCLLAAATLEKSEDLYDYDSLKFDNNLLKERIELLRERYSGFTADFITSMLEEDPNARPSFSDLNSKLLPYQETIRTGQELPFSKDLRGSVRREKDRPSLRNEVPIHIEDLPFFDISKYSYQDRISPFIEHFIVDETNKFYAYNLYPHTASPTKGVSYTQSMFVRSPIKERAEFAEAMLSQEKPTFGHQHTSGVIRPDLGDVEGATSL
mmetsp:Transcript_37162/g.43390  ORF Transcript_37162/g.43390 Transcript_37162/m.43390 type:complete len:439 (+) Transcript_37162:49-1365(+)